MLVLIPNKASTKLGHYPELKRQPVVVISAVDDDSIIKRG